MFLASYRQHLSERAALGIPALPLTAPQTSDVIELLKNPPAGEADFLLDLLVNRVPAGWTMPPRSRPATWPRSPSAARRTR